MGCFSFVSFLLWSDEWFVLRCWRAVMSLLFVSCLLIMVRNGFSIAMVVFLLSNMAVRIDINLCILTDSVGKLSCLMVDRFGGWGWLWVLGWRWSWSWSRRRSRCRCRCYGWGWSWSWCWNWLRLFLRSSRCICWLFSWFLFLWGLWCWGGLSRFLEIFTKSMSDKILFRKNIILHLSSCVVRILWEVSIA